MSDVDFCCHISISLCLLLFLLAPHNVCFPPWFWYLQNASMLHTFLIWNDFLQFCPRKFHCRWSLREERCVSTHMQPGSDARAIWLIYLDVFRLFAFSNAWFYSHIFPSATGLSWLAHIVLPVLSWMCHPSLSTLASHCLHHASLHLPLLWPQKCYSSCSVKNPSYTTN